MEKFYTVVEHNIGDVRERVHNKKYVNLIYRLAETSKPYDIETPASPQILEATRLIGGCVIEVGKAVHKSEISHRAELDCG
jgi:acetoin utilization deacetylase AcuC-like enzyme